MDPAVLEALLCMREDADTTGDDGYASDVMNVSFITTLLKYCTTVDDCVHVLKTSKLKPTFATSAMFHAYSEERFACAEVLIKWRELDQRDNDAVMLELLDWDDNTSDWRNYDKYATAKHFIDVSGYNLRHVNWLPVYAYKSKMLLKLFMEKADGMHLLFKQDFDGRTPLQYVLTRSPAKKRIHQYLRQLQFLSSFNILTAPQPRDHPMNPMPLDMFRLIGAMLVY